MKYESLRFLDMWSMAGFVIFSTCLFSSPCKAQDNRPIVNTKYESIKPEVTRNNTKLLAWKLGTNLGWTFALRLNYPPQMEDKMFKSLEKTKFIAKSLGLTEITWPEKRGARASNKIAIIDHLAELSGQKSAEAIGPQLIRKYGGEHAIYFDIAMNCMSAYINYSPGSRDNAVLISGLEKYEKTFRETSGNPQFQSAWKPVVEAIKQSLPPTIVFARIQEMDNKISHNLASDVRN